MIRFDSVGRVYAGSASPALDDMTFEILRGEFVFLVGASGSGKSSILRLILLEDKPTTGQVHVLGQDLRRISPRKVPYYRRNIGMVFQDFRLLQGKTVFENVAYALQVLGKSRGHISKAVPDVLETVGLAGLEDRFPHELSGGEQQRVAIARAVVNKPAILLADEPTGNLDPATSRGIMALLKRINQNGTTVVMATHDVSIVDEEKRRVIELIDGRLVRDESSGVYQPEIVEPADEHADAGADESASASTGADDRSASGRERRTIAETMDARVRARDAASDADAEAAQDELGDLFGVDRPADGRGFGRANEGGAR